jgi:DNA-binding transcriptional regulator YiaG
VRPRTAVRGRRRAPEEYITGAELRRIRAQLGLGTEKFGREFDLTGRRIRALEAEPDQPVPYLVGRRAQELARER